MDATLLDSVDVERTTARGARCQAHQVAPGSCRSRRAGDGQRAVCPDNLFHFKQNVTL
jgi:hypothetical protein